MTGRSDAKQRLLEQRLAARAPAGPAPIPPRPDGPVPLSAGQAALLYEYHLRPDRPVYNVVHRYRFRGPVDLDRLAAAVVGAAGRHEPLCVSFGPERRRLAPSEAVRVVEVAGDDDDFAALAEREASTRVDLEDGPLLRVALVRLDDGDTGVVLALHHVSSDAAALANLWRDIDLAYRGVEPDPLPTTYGDHAAWQRARREAADERFWHDHLGPEPRPTTLGLAPVERPEPDGLATTALPVDAAVLAAAGLRPVPFFLGQFAALLQRYAAGVEPGADGDHGDDLVVGVAASTRDHPDVDPLVGYFLTVLPVRLRVDPAATTTGLVARTEATLAAALAHRHLPYAEIAAGLRRRGVAHPDPARVLFVYDEPHTARLGGLEAEGVLVHNGVAVSDLTVFVHRRDDGRFDASAEWDGRRYRRQDMETLLGQFAVLVGHGARRPERPWSEAVTGGDLHGPALDGPLVPLPVMIADQARRTPDAPAVRCGGRCLTYVELDRAAATVAAALTAHGVGRGDRVAMQLRRSVEAIAVLLGIQRLGAAYVPVDAAHPPARLTSVARQATVRLIVRDDADQADPGDGPVPTVTARMLLAGPDDDPVDDGTDGPTEPTTALDDVAYVIFTSGSTGTPRGVVVRHRHLAASTLARSRFYEEEAVDGFLMVSSLGFDSSVAGTFWTLAAGGVLVLPTEDEVHDVDALAGLVRREAVSHLLMVPSLYQALLRRDADALGTLRCAIVAGEACPATLVDDHHRLLDGVALVNEYGPTETTVWATAQRCRPGRRTVPIGRAIAGVSLRVADPWSRPRPPGVAGELIIGGTGVTDGYLDGDAGAFADDPVLGRVYRSGDQVRLDADGNLLFLGRTDHQLSVGGVRIEAEEIEAALVAAGAGAAVVRIERRLRTDPLRWLGDLPPTDAAAVLADAATAADPARALSEDIARRAEGGDVLVAYVEPPLSGATATDVDPAVDPAALTARLREMLPDAVVPRIIEVVATLPRTEHGKIDRRALGPPLRVPAPRGNTATSGEVSDGFVPAVLLNAWRQVLGIDDVTADSDFFAAGGDSLRAVELVAVLEERLGRRVPVSALVLGRTPRRLAELVGTATLAVETAAGPRRSFVVPLRPHGERPPLIVLPPGGGNLVVFDPFVQAFDRRVPVIGFDLPGADRDDELPTSIDDLCDTYLPQIRGVQPHGPYRFLGWSFGGVVAVELATRLAAEGEPVELVAMIDTLVPGLQRAGRARIYTELVRDLDVAGLARQVHGTVRVRLMLATAAWRGRRAAARGETLTPTDRNTWLTIKVDEIVERHRPRPYAGKVLFLAAEDTRPWRTTEPWRRLLPDLEVVVLEGSHEGADGLLTGERAARVAAEVAARLT